MIRKPRRLALGVIVSMVVLGIVVAFVTPWARSCEEERARARAAWAAYETHLAPNEADADRVEAAREVHAALSQGPGVALEAASASFSVAPAPDDDDGADLYREAMETLALAETACEP